MSLFGRIGGFLRHTVQPLAQTFFPAGRIANIAGVNLAQFGKVGAAVGAASLLSSALRRKGPGPGPVPTGAVGAVAGTAVGARALVGRFSGSPIPRGTKEKISRSGAIILTERHRGRGLTTRDLRGFRRTIGLLRSVGMVPKRLHVRPRRRHRGNPE